MFPNLLLWLDICIFSNLEKWHALEMTVFYLKGIFQYKKGGKIFYQ